MKIEKLKPGMTVWDVHSYTMGNTTARSVGTWQVSIIEVDIDRRTVTASWNGNPAKKYFENSWSKWRLERPQLIAKAGWGYRLATREEKAAAKLKAAK